MYVSGKLPTYPSPNPTFCPTVRIRVNVRFAEGRWAVSQKHTLIQKINSMVVALAITTGILNS